MYNYSSFLSSKNISDQETTKLFCILNVIVIFVIMLSSSDNFIVATPDETNGQESEFSLFVNLKNKKSMNNNITNTVQLHYSEMYSTHFSLPSHLN